MAYHHPPSTTSTSSTMFRAVVFNNEGVRRIENELYNDAVASFTVVLQELNPILPNSPAQHMLRDSTTITTPSTTPFQVSTFSSHQRHYPLQQQQQREQQQQRQRQQQQEVCTSESRKEWGSGSSSSTLPIIHDSLSNGEREHFIFRDPIEIPLDVLPTMEEPTDRLVNKFVVVVLYNLALSVHLSALQCHDRNCLIRARKLYELAFRMHLEESSDVTLLYSLALMNNLGLIYHALGEEDRSKTCFKNMLTTMMYLLESDEAKTIKQWDGLFSNVMDRIFREQKVAAPAA
jgi:hypothetical protein